MLASCQIKVYIYIYIYIYYKKKKKKPDMIDADYTTYYYGEKRGQVVTIETLSLSIFFIKCLWNILLAKDCRKF